MTISEKDVRHIARLARLELKSEEVALYQKQLERILESMAELGTLDTSKTEPTRGGLEASNVLREDVLKRFDGTEALLANAPAREGPYFKVKKVLE